MTDLGKITIKNWCKLAYLVGIYFIIKASYVLY